VSENCIYLNQQRQTLSRQRRVLCQEEMEQDRSGAEVQAPAGGLAKGMADVALEEVIVPAQARGASACAHHVEQPLHIKPAYLATQSIVQNAVRR
jgi:hypothetical protein